MLPILEVIKAYNVSHLPVALRKISETYPNNIELTKDAEWYLKKAITMAYSDKPVAEAHMWFNANKSASLVDIFNKAGLEALDKTARHREELNSIIIVIEGENTPKNQQTIDDVISVHFLKDSPEGIVRLDLQPSLCQLKIKGISNKWDQVKSATWDLMASGMRVSLHDLENLEVNQEVAQKREPLDKCW